MQSSPGPLPQGTLGIGPGLWPSPFANHTTIQGRGPCPLEGNLAALLGAHNPRCYYARGHGEDST